MVCKSWGNQHFWVNCSFRKTSYTTGLTITSACNRSTHTHTNHHAQTSCHISVKKQISPGGGDGSEVFAHCLNDTSTPNPQTSTDSQAAIEQQPDRCGRFLHHPTLVVNQPQGHQRTNCITVEKTKQTCSHVKINTMRIQTV